MPAYWDNRSLEPRAVLEAAHVEDKSIEHSQKGSTVIWGSPDGIQSIHTTILAPRPVPPWLSRWLGSGRPRQTKKNTRRLLPKTEADRQGNERGREFCCYHSTCAAPESIYSGAQGGIHEPKIPPDNEAKNRLKV